MAYDTAFDEDDNNEEEEDDDDEEGDDDDDDDDVETNNLGITGSSSPFYSIRYFVL